MIRGRLYTTHAFDSIESATAMLRTVTSATALQFDRYGASDPFEHDLDDADDLERAAKLLSGYPAHLEGGVRLGDRPHEAALDVSFRANRLVEWRFNAADSLVGGTGEQTELVEFFTDLCHENDVLFAGVDHADAWDTESESNDGTSSVAGESDEPSTLDVLDCHHQLPGLYWFTYLDAAVVDGLEIGDDVSARDPRDRDELEGVALQLSDTPLDVERTRAEASDLVREFGEQFFYGRSTGAGATIGVLRELMDRDEEAVGHGSVVPYLRQEAAESVRREVRSVDGNVFEDPESLASVLVVYLDGEVARLGEYDLAALNRLDRYFDETPQRALYSADHLNDELIPALGAYLGVILADAFDVDWTTGDPITSRRLVWQEGERPDISPFHLAYHVINHDAKITDFCEYLRADS